MLFSTITFIFYLLPIFLLGYDAAGGRTGALPPGEPRINAYGRARKRWIHCAPQVVEIASGRGSVQ